MTSGHLVVLILAAIGTATAIKWLALAAFWISGTDPYEFVARVMEGD